MNSRRDRGTEAAVEIVMGPHAALETLRAGKRAAHRLFLAREEGAGSSRRSSGWPGRATCRLNCVHGPNWIGRCAGRRIRASYLEVGPFPYADAEILVAEMQRGAEPGFLLVLDGVQDPQNLGAIVRSADAAGVQACVLPRDRAAGVSPAVVRASAGATEHLPIARVANLATFLETAKSHGLWVVGTDAAEGRDLFATDLTGPIALVIGGEERGMRALTKSRCDLTVRIPARGRVASLNASAAAAVCLFEVSRQRSQRA